MNWFSRLFRKDDTGQILTTQQLAEYLWRGGKSVAGVNVTPATAMTYSAVFSCTRVLSEGVAMLPCQVYRRTGRTTKPEPGHRLYSILHDSPNDFQTAQEFWEWVIACLCLRGNAYAFINRTTRGVAELLPITPMVVQPKLLPDGGTVVYDVTLNAGLKRFSSADILHIKLFTLDGFVGLSPVAWQRETMGMGLAAQEHGARLFANASRPSGLISTDKKLSPEASKRLIADVEEIVGGLENTGKTLVMGDGMKWQQIGMSSEDAQWLEGRKFTRSEIAGIYRVPPHLIGDLERSTNNNIEHQGQSFLSLTLVPYLRRIEQRVAMQLLTVPERQSGLYAKFNANALVRGDMAARGTFYKAGVTDGWLTRNEVRELEELNPIDGLDLPLMPLNMTDGTKPPAAAQSATVVDDGAGADAEPDGGECTCTCAPCKAGECDGCTDEGCTCEGCTCDAARAA
jgi:HK97 family phage portal protein